MDLNLSSISIVLSIIFVVVGLLLSLMFVLKRSENLSEEDKINGSRGQLLWVGAAALAAVSIYLAKVEKKGKWGSKSSGSRTASSLL